MRKIKYFIVALLVSMVALTGCSKKNSLSPSEAINKAVKNIQESKNYKMTLDMTIGMSMGESMSFETSINGDIAVDTENGITYTKMIANALGQQATNETYVDTKSQNGKMIVYTKVSTDDNWTKTESDYNEDKINYGRFFEKLEKSKNIKELNPDKNNYNYEVTVSAEDFKELASSIGDNESLSTLSELKGDLKIKISIDKETGNYSKLYVDMKKLMEEAMNTSGAQGVKITKAEFTFIVSDLNKAGEIKIPSEALNAKTNNEEENNINSFVYDDYDEVLTCSASEENITSEITFGFINDKYAKAYEEINQTFDTETEAEELYEELNEENEENQFVYRLDKKVSITTYYDPEDDQKDYTYSDVKSIFEGNGYICE